MFDDGWINTWVYVPVTSESDPVAFEFDGLSWTFSEVWTLENVWWPPCEPGVICSA
jgi:hypothetical protein